MSGQNQIMLKKEFMTESNIGDSFHTRSIRRVPVFPGLMGIVLVLFASSSTLIAQDRQSLGKDNMVEQFEGSLEGIWQGVLTAGSSRIRFIFRISRDGEDWKAVVENPEQSTTSVPVESVTLEGHMITMEVAVTAGVYEGEINTEGNRITGFWKQRGGSYPLDLEPVDKVERIARPQDPTPPFPYVEEEVRFRNDDAGIYLAGTLTHPRGDGPYAAVVMVTGSGGQNRDEEVMNHRPFWVIADFLTRRGFAVLRYDDRGIASSEGDAATGTSEDFAEDAWAGAELLMEHPKIAPSRIGIIGHSEGGLIATMLAAEHREIAFIVLLAGPGLPGDEIIAQQSVAILRASGASEEQIKPADETNRKIYDIVKREPDDEKAAREIGDILRSFGVPEELIEGQISGLLSPWYRFYLSYDPQPALKRITCPVLAIIGDLDLQVLADENLRVIGDALEAGGNEAVTLKKFEGLNHLFQHAQTGLVQEYAVIEETFAPEVLEYIGDWLSATIQE